MKEKKYSLKRIRVYMIASISVLILSDLAILLAELLDYGWLQIGVTIAVIVIEALFLYRVFNILYAPSTKLKHLVEEYKSNTDADEHTPLDDADDLVEEISQILKSLNTMELKQKNAEILMKNAEINNLQDQINPHFLYNTLEVIRGEALISGERKIAEMTAALANYFRYNISRNESFVYLKDELKNSMNYFNIQKNRFGDKIFCEILYHDIDEKEVENCYIPKLILQPLIENAIYHGLELKMGEGTVKIHITIVDQNLRITVADDGLGMTKEKLLQINKGIEGTEESGRHNGVAVNNIKERLKLYWGEKAYMMATSEMGIGTQIHLSMPLLYQKEDYMN